MGNAPNANFAAGLLSVAFYMFIMLASCYMFIERGWNPLYAVTLLSSFGLAFLMNPHLDIANVILRGRIDEPPEEPHGAPAPVPAPAPPIDERGMGPFAWNGLRAIAISWLLGVCIFFVVIYCHIQARLDPAATAEEHIAELHAELLGGTWTMGSLLRLLIEVFVITFIAVFTLLISCQLLAQGLAQLGR